MGDLIELDGVDALGAGAVGAPGARAFYIQAGKDGARLTVLVEKEQIALLATEAVAFLDRLAEDFPEDGGEPHAPSVDAEIEEPAVPLFRARMIGLGFEPDRRLVLLELRESSDDEDDEDEEPENDEDEEDGFVARIYATRSQVRAMAASGAAAVAAGRPTCPLCEQPIDPAGHQCPRWN
ncbi:MAG: DUF3090 family protein [Actinobacteria bacterium]|nr:DUF3090 family protein [Actinomycetota bacterium]